MAGQTVAPLTYSKADAATALGISVKTLDRIVKDGDLNLRLIRGKRVIEATELESYVGSLPYVVAEES